MQQRFTISTVAPDWHEITVLKTVSPDICITAPKSEKRHSGNKRTNRPAVQKADIAPAPLQQTSSEL